jgi:hypothetical protein
MRGSGGGVEQEEVSNQGMRLPSVVSSSYANGLAPSPPVFSVRQFKKRSMSKTVERRSM